ncbi:CRP/FNR family transcriptional regulator [Arcticibacter tournemirensis]|uniref:Crp/Fnr family transcriptional regulator n=2 Tax=Arcticibacter tournemirensis TaxID=699437 RepID=A0A5M9HC53_9SPHI|nr:Crp/Fnr family transcriptional regulator [Arcticibacter tournemirensis]TQM51637.1 CRP/FNR family transcriptional regulator [Arcticibacter tournemirensis]
MKECKNVCDTQSCFVCQRCLPDWLPAVKAQRINFEVKKGQSIFAENDLVSGIYFIYSGTVKVHKRWDKDKELIIRFAKAGDIMGHLGLGKDPKYPVSATALEPTVLCYIDRAFFESTLKVNTDLTFKLMHFFADELQHSRKSMLDFVHMSVKARIAKSLIALRNQFGMSADNTINLELSRQDLASFSGASYETLFKVVNELTLNKIVELTGRRIKILDEAELLNIINQDNLNVK